ncbi:MAG: gamma-glutamyltransferase [Bryobacterales bacterium]|nr:gamma-glutamyltransferase [Bryobacterales bacterium]
MTIFAQRRFWIASALLLVAAAGAVAQRKAVERPARHAVRGARGAVAAGTEAAAQAGMRTFVSGGNAVDAGVASMFAASIGEYSHFGFGGESPILVRTKDGAVHSIAGVGPMPKLASAELFRNRRLQPGEMLSPPEDMGLRGFIPVAGLMPALVPGMVEAGLVALREFGTMSFSDVIAPAIELADGNPMDEQRASSIDRSRRFFELWPTSQKVFRPGGRTPRPGEVFRQPDLARTLRAMRDAEARALAAGATRTAAIDAVRDFFYRGEIARRIGQFSQDNGGLLRYEDMAGFRLKPEEPLATTYRGYTVYKPGFWSQGPSMLQALNILENYDLRAMRFNTGEYTHTLAEALKLAYADRDTYYGDPAFSRIPPELVTKDYARDRKALIGPMASLDFRPGRLSDPPAVHPSETHMMRVRIDDALMARDTTCVTTADKDGILFSATPSGAWMPSVIAGDTGIPLTQRAQSFLLVEGHPNELAGGKRPRITLSPTLVTAADGKPFMTLTTPGGDNQDQALLQILLAVVEFGMNAQEAVEAPRFQTRHLVSSFDNHAMNPGDLLLDERFAPEVSAELAERRHKVGSRSRWASGSAPVAIRVTPRGVIEAGADPYGYRTAHAW